MYGEYAIRQVLIVMSPFFALLPRSFCRISGAIHLCPDRCLGVPVWVVFPTLWYGRVLCGHVIGEVAGQIVEAICLGAHLYAGCEPWLGHPGSEP
jgi:hypothetical protein